MEPLRNEARSAEYRDAFKVVALAKNVLFVIILLSILVQVAGVVVVEVMSPAGGTAKGAGTAGAGVPFRAILHWVLPATKFIALAACLLLVLTLVFSVELSLVGGLGGTAGLVRAFFVSLVLLAMLVPWQQMLKSSFAAGALFNLGQLERARGRPRDDIVSQAFHFARFIAYPIVAMIVLVIVQIAFSKGYRKMSLPPVVRITDAPGGPEQTSS